MRIKGILTEISFHEIEKIWKEKGIAGGTVSIYGALPFRPSDWHYSITKMKFNATDCCLSIWIDAYGEDNLLQIWGPQEIKLEENEFVIRDAEKLIWTGVEKTVVNTEAALKIN